MENRRSSIWVLINLVGALYCIFASLINDLEYMFFLLPLTYTILLFLCRNNRDLIGEMPGLTVINVVLFFRYTVVPVVLCSGTELSIYANNYSHMTSSIIMMLYEMVAIFVTLEITANKAWRTYQEQFCDEQTTIIVKPPFIIGAFIIILLGGIYFANKSLLSNISLITTGTISEGESINDVSSLSKILWQCLTAWVYVYGVNRQKDRYERSGRNNIHVILSIVYTLLFIVVAYIGQASISRWYTLVTAISSIFLLKTLFPRETKKILALILIPVLVLLMSASIFKSGLYLVGNNKGFFSSMRNLITPTSGDAYFAGPVSVNNAIGLNADNNVSIFNSIYDVFNNMPLANHFIESGHSTVYLYNLYLGRIFSGTGDQIIPLVGQSYIFFSGIFSPLLSVVSILFLRWADKKFVTKTNYMRYVWAFVGVWLGLQTILNMTINLSWFYIRIIPLFVVFWFIGRISPRQVIRD